MLSALKKVLSGIAPEGQLEDAEAEQALLKNEDGSMSVITAEMFAELSAKLDSSTNLITEQANTITSLTEKLTELEGAKSALEQEAKAKELSDKKSLLASAIGSENEKLEAVFESLKDLPQAAFNTVVDSMKLNLKLEEETPEFKELGVSGEASSVDEDSPEMKILKNKYKQ